MDYEVDYTSADSSDANEQNMFTSHVSATFSPKVISTSTIDLSLINSSSPVRKRRRSSESVEALPTVSVQPFIVNDELDIFGN